MNETLEKLIEVLQMLKAYKGVDTDFEVGDKVVVQHTRKDGTELFITGEVIETLAHDDEGYYTRILGDNGNHYRTGLKVLEERLNTRVVALIEQ